MPELPDVSYDDDDEDHDDNEFDHLPASSDDDGETPIASSDPLDYEDASDAIVSAISLFVRVSLDSLAACFV